ncbi:O-antigen polymerase [Clostridiales bacterium oral taxon 876 str. F0540]|nr:O-antigen polymerase [Clostridiales bacterium oral taxon 876 str. F0540]
MKNKGLSILIYLYIIMLPILPGKFRIGIIPFNGDVLLAAIIVFYGLIIILNKASRERFIKGIRDFCKNYFSIFALILLVMMFCSVAYAQYKAIALTESIRFLTYIILYFIIKYEVNDKSSIDNIIRCFITTIIILCIIGFVQAVTKVGVGEFIYHGNYGTRVRVPSTLGNPNSFGGLLILSIFPVIMLTISEKRSKAKLLYFISSIMIFSNILLTESRNAWLGLAIGAFVLTIVYNIRLVFVFLGVGSLTLLIPQIFARIKEFTDMSQNIGRIQLWQLALIIIKEHPFKGIGNGNYQKMYSYYTAKYPELNYNHHTEFTVHNNYLKVQSELGILGTIGFLGMIISAVVRIKKLIAMDLEKKYVSFFKGFLASLIAFAFINLSDDFFLVPKIASYFWIIIAVGEALHYKINNSVIIQEDL